MIRRTKRSGRAEWLDPDVWAWALKPGWPRTWIVFTTRFHNRDNLIMNYPYVDNEKLTNVQQFEKWTKCD